MKLWEDWKWFREEQTVKRLAWLLIVIGAGLRIYKFFIAGPVSFDEAYSYWVGSKSLLKVLALSAVDKHPPLFYLFMHFWGYWGHSEIWIRLPSLVASLLSLIVFWRLACRVFSARALALLALMLFTVDLAQIHYAAIARSYAIATMLVLLSTWTFFEILEGSASKRTFIYNLISNVLLILLIYTGAFVFLVQSLVMIYFWWQKGERQKDALSWLKYHRALLGIFVLMIPYVYHQLSVGGFAPKWIAKLVGEPYLFQLFTQGTLLNLELFRVDDRIFKMAVGFTIATVIFLAAILKKDQLQFEINKDPKFWYLAVVYGMPPIVFWLISKIEPIFVPRYFIIFYFAYFLLLVYALGHIKFLNRISFLLVFAFIAGEMPLLKVLYTDFFEESDWKTKAAIIQKNWQDGDVLLVIPHADLIRTKFYLKHPENYKVDKKLFKSIFKRRDRQVTTADLDSVFRNWQFPYKRIWFHEERKTGLSAEFEVVQKEGFVYHYLDSLFQKVDSLDFEDKRGQLSLFLLEKPKRPKGVSSSKD